MAQIEKRDITRVNMNLPTQMVTKVKEYADSLGLPVTQAYTVLINKALDYEEVLMDVWEWGPAIYPRATSHTINLIIIKY